MAGPFDIQRVARGLPDLLGMKATGASNAQLAPELRPVLDLWNPYTIDRLTIAGDTTAVVNGTGQWPGASGTLVVPAGQVWDVRNLTLQRTAALAAGTVYNLCFSIDRGFGLWTVEGPPVAFDATSSPLHGIRFAPGSLLLRGSEKPSLVCTKYTAGTAVAFTLLMEYVPLLV